MLDPHLAERICWVYVIRSSLFKPKTKYLIDVKLVLTEKGGKKKDMKLKIIRPYLSQPTKFEQP